MIENKTNTTQMPTSVYDAYFIAESPEQPYPVERVEIGLFSTETFALEFAIIKIKKSIENLCDVLSENIKIKKAFTKEEIIAVKKVIEFLKETHNSLNGDFTKEEIDELIEKIMDEIIDNLSVQRQMEISDRSDIFDPFCHEFFNSYGEPDTVEMFTLVIEERFIDQVL